MEYLFQKGARSCMSLSWMLRFFNSTNIDIQDVKRLLDKGATPEYVNNRTINYLYKSRLDSLKQCMAFIGCITKRKPGLKTKGLSKDVYTIIGKMMWETRFD